MSVLYLLNASATDDELLSMAALHTSLLSDLSSSADTAASSSSLLVSGTDAGWDLLASYLVFVASLGFALIQAGSAKASNMKNVLYQAAVTTLVSIIGWWFIGYGLTQGTARGFADMADAVTDSHSQMARFMLLWSSSNMAGLIVCGAVAARINMTTLVMLAFLITSVVFPITTYWLHSGGFMSIMGGRALGVIDFTCGIPVHIIGGVSAATAAFLVGPRFDRFAYDAETGRMIDRREPGHSIVFAALGTFLLWFAWLAYTSGGSLGITGDGHLVAGLAAVNSLLAAGVASLLLTAHHITFNGVHNLWQLLTGILCGLVAIAPCAATVPAWAALLLGALSVPTYRGGVRLLAWLRIDDASDACAVHAFCGALGSILAGLLSEQTLLDRHYGAGVFELERGRQFGVQILAVVGAVVIAILATALPLLAMRRLFCLRVDIGAERGGLDAVYHGGFAYPDFASKMLILKNQVVLEAELGAAVKSVAAAGGGTGKKRQGGKTVGDAAAQMELVTEKIRQLDEMRKAKTAGVADRRTELSAGGPMSKRASFLVPRGGLPGVGGSGVISSGLTPPVRGRPLARVDAPRDLLPPTHAWRGTTDEVASSTRRKTPHGSSVTPISPALEPSGCSTQRPTHDIVMTPEVNDTGEVHHIRIVHQSWSGADDSHVAELPGTFPATAASPAPPSPVIMRLPPNARADRDRRVVTSSVTPIAPAGHLGSMSPDLLGSPSIPLSPSLLPSPSDDHQLDAVCESPDDDEQGEEEYELAPYEGPSSMPASP